MQKIEFANLYYCFSGLNCLSYAKNSSFRIIFQKSADAHAFDTSSRSFGISPLPEGKSIAGLGI